MRNYPNMSYCAFSNTLLALNQVVEIINDDGVESIMKLPKSEQQAFEDLYHACQEFMKLAEEHYESV